jgi:hypothetical protein
MVSSVHPLKCLVNVSFRRLPLPSKSSGIHFSIALLLYHVRAPVAQLVQRLATALKTEGSVFEFY